jgi:hypothetical protein
MNRTKHIALLIAALAMPAFADDKPSVIKDVMKAAHKAPKGETELCKKVIGGTATDAEKQQLIACYKKLIGTEAPKGDAADWKKRTEALLASAEGAVKGGPDAIAKYKEAVSCKACHTEHKP